MFYNANSAPPPLNFSPVLPMTSPQGLSTSECPRLLSRVFNSATILIFIYHSNAEWDVLGRYFPAAAPFPREVRRLHFFFFFPQIPPPFSFAIFVFLKSPLPPSRRTFPLHYANGARRDLSSFPCNFAQGHSNGSSFSQTLGRISPPFACRRGFPFPFFFFL